jgi:hypothetical protein
MTATALLVLYDHAQRLLRAGVRPRRPSGVREYLCLGAPTTVVPAEALQLASAALGAPVVPLPITLPPEDYRAAAASVAARASRIARMAPEADAGLPWAVAKSNDRVLYRLLPYALVEELLRRALRAGLGERVVVPWLADDFALVERAGLFDLDAPGHQFRASVDRLAREAAFSVEALWPKRVARERVALSAAHAAMTAARTSILLARNLRDQRRVADHATATSARPAIGLLIGGTSVWSSLRPLLPIIEERARPVLVAHDIFRNPSAYRALRAAAVPFVTVDSALSPPRLAQVLAGGLSKMSRIRRDLEARARDGRSAAEDLRVLAADAAAIPELEVYVEQIRATIRRHRLRALVSGNIIDAFLSATTYACHAEGIPHVCVQNAAFARIPLPVYADCDLFLAESERAARFLREHGARGEVAALGLPSYDELARRGRDRRPLAKLLPIIGDRKVVTVTTQTSLVDVRPLIEALIARIERRSDAALVIKLHPREEPGAYRDLVEHVASRGLGGKVHHLDAIEVLAGTDRLVSVMSTTLLWALVMGVPPFSWIEPRMRLSVGSVDFMDPAVIPMFETADETAEAVLASLDRPDHDWPRRRERFLAENVTGADGRASRRIVERILSLVDRETPCDVVVKTVGGT